MKITARPKMKTIKVSDFNLEHTIDSGQIFRYEKTNDDYYVVIGDVVIKIRQAGNKLQYSSSKKISEKKLKHFFGLEDDLPKILLAINKDKLMNKAIAKYRGLRLIHQDPTECLPSFIASAFSNIPKIKMSLNKMSEKFGKKILFDGKTFYSFPRLKDINDLAELKKCSLGFRAERIYGLRNLGKKYFDKLKKLSYADAKKELMKLDGVGSKVADCVLLFSLEHTHAFPTDVWVERVIARNYLKNLRGKKTNIKMIEEFGKNYFGKYAGYAQQYLYHYVRNI